MHVQGLKLPFFLHRDKYSCFKTPGNMYDQHILVLLKEKKKTPLVQVIPEQVRSTCGKKKKKI